MRTINKKHIVIISGVTFFAVAFFVFIFGSNLARDRQIPAQKLMTQSTSNIQQTTIPVVNPEVTMIAAGDIMLSRNVSVQITKYGADYPFQNIYAYTKSADIVFANLECPITVGPAVPTGSMIFHAQPGVQNGLVDAGVSVVSLANNHVPNYGAQGILDTIKYLDNVGIGHAGAGKDENSAEAPQLFEVKGIKFALLAYNDRDVVPASYGADVNHPGTNLFDLDKVARNVKSAKELVDVVIISMHAGHEYQDVPDKSQVTFAHAAIDAGADVVIGSHPHVVQPVEIYKGKYIFYSLGNFVFDQAFSPNVLTGMTLMLTFSKDGLDNVEYNPVAIKNLSQPELITDSVVATKVDFRLRLGEASAPTWKPQP